MIPITGAQYEISAGEYQATVTELGAGLRALRHRGQPVITEYRGRGTGTKYDDGRRESSIRSVMPSSSNAKCRAGSS